MPTIDLATAEQLRSAAPDEPLGWVPNPCYLCSPRYSIPNPVRGTGLDPADPSRPCPACGHLDPGIRGYGPQAFALTRPETEIFFGGAKGGAKTDAMTIWMVSGNPSEVNTKPRPFGSGRPPKGEPERIVMPENVGYHLHPQYRGLVLRRTGKDLRSWIELAKRYYSKLGGVYANFRFHFPSGAIIWTGHLEDSDSYTAYLGMTELHRIAIEELTLIPQEELYIQLLGCMRTATPTLRPQIFSTANPVGPGVGWVKARFVKVPKPGSNGKEFYVPRETIRYKIKLKLTGEEQELTRIYIPSGLRDNPYLLADRQYIALLESMPTKLRRAYLDGDWDVLVGVYFEDFRAERDPAEPPSACHVITPDRRPSLPFWWSRAMGGDWGFAHECAYHWGAKEPKTGRVIVYREFGGSGISAEEQGVEIARRSLPDLNAHPSHSLTLWYSRDAFQRRSNDYGIRSFVELIARGISRVIGEDAVHVPEIKMIHGSLEASPEFQAEYDDWRERMAVKKASGIEIRMCNSNRVLGWSYARDLMRWTPPIEDQNPAFDYATWLFLATQRGASEAAEYMAQFAEPSDVYPKLQIVDCPRLVEAIPIAQHDEKNPEDVSKAHFRGMDYLDSWRYLLLGLRDGDVEPPPQEARRMAVEQWRLENPSATGMDMVSMHRQMEAEDREKQKGLGFSVDRSAVGAGRRSRDEWRKALRGR